jgi:hypothetical protein
VAVPKCKNWNELKNKLQKQGITTAFKCKGNTDEVQGVMFQKNGYAFNGSKIDRQLSAVNTMTEKLENIIEEVRKPTKVEHRHQHTIGIASNWFFLSWVALVIVILGLFWAIANQRQTISQYNDNDSKYRYIKMRGQINEDNLYRLKQQFKSNDSIKIIRKQVERYEELVKEQVERMERAKRSNEEVERLRKEAEQLKLTIKQ